MGVTLGCICRIHPHTDSYSLELILGGKFKCRILAILKVHRSCDRHMVPHEFECDLLAPAMQG